ncbi:YadA-like family protein [Xenorhabdus bovienii]|uniref:YadA-like family protein n=1 Tax=Xenorhabdus bovienii TaxID=40576 RepID=UPI0023B26F52|nr:YadA-like family protein [Xenorhabdus bovienii]MDE9487582.1 YadA-like family protein [Xenorhabdus bovienii]
MKMHYFSVLTIAAMTMAESHADTVVDSITDKGHTLRFLQDARGNIHDGFTSQNYLDNNSRNNKLFGLFYTLTNSSNNTIGSKKGIYYDETDNIWRIPVNYNTLKNSNNNIIDSDRNNLNDSNNNNIYGNYTTLTHSNRNKSIKGNNNTLTDSSDNQNISGEKNNLTYSDKNHINGNQNHLTNATGNNISGHENHLTDSQENTITYNNNTLISSAKNTVSGTNNKLYHTTNSYIKGNDNYIIDGNNLFKDNKHQPLSQITLNKSVLGGAGNAGVGSSVTEISTNVALGYNSTATTTATELKNSVAINANGAAGDHVIAIGGHADGNNSTAIGAGSSSTNEGIAIGHGSIAKSVDELNIGQRQITSVKAGTEASHIINVKQLNNSRDDTLKKSETYTQTEMRGLSNNTKAKAETMQLQANKHTDDTLLPMEDDAKERFQRVTLQSIHHTDDQTAKHQALFDEISKKYTDSRFDKLGQDIDKKQKRINAGIASAMATSVIPQKVGHTLSVGLGVATYRDQTAGAVGSVFTVSPHIQIKVAMTYDTQSGTGLNSGIAIGF